LQAFAKGFVKEGVGAGGASIVAITKSRGKITGKKLMTAIEKEYEVSIESAGR
jgi:NaMN:DMB phosphoribosyltransferase